jgi:hypothetical protein
MADDRDPCSEFQRAFSALGLTHLVAPSPQAKGKIERRFGTLQQRLVALLAYEHVSDYPAAQVVLDRQAAHQNATVCRSTGYRPNVAWDKALKEKRSAMRPCPPSPPTRAALGASLEPPGQCRQSNRLLGTQLAHCPDATCHHHPHPSSATPVLGRNAATLPTAKYLAGNLGKLLPLTFLLLNSHRILLLNSRRHRK